MDVVGVDLASRPVNASGFVLEVEETYDPPTTPLDATGQGDPYASYAFAAQAVASGAMDVVIGGGVEAMSRVPIGSTTEHGPGEAYGPTVRVNTLMPGPFLTDISAAWNLDNAGDFNPFAGYALQRAGDPREIVGAAVFLMSDASSFTTGSILHADGGFP